MSRTKGKAGLAGALHDKIKAKGFKCFLTGEPLSLDSFELDHVNPVVNGGKALDPDNLEAVTPEANKAKGTLEFEDFVQLCNKVARTHPM